MKKIGFMDSGVGGLSVLAEANKQWEDVEFLYYADLKNSPYGNKDKSQIIQYSIEAVDFLLQKNVDAIAIACNTATSAAIEVLRATYSLPIFGMEPAVKQAFQSVGQYHKSSQDYRSAKIAVMATPLTLREQKFLALVDSLSLQDSILSVECEGLSSLIDQEKWAEAIAFVQKASQSWKEQNVKAIVLGCTHYIFLSSTIRTLQPQIPIFDGNKGVVQRMETLLGMSHRNRLNLNPNPIVFYTNGTSDPQWETKAERMMAILQKPQIE